MLKYLIKNNNNNKKWDSFRITIFLLTQRTQLTVNWLRNNKKVQYFIEHT